VTSTAELTLDTSSYSRLQSVMSTANQHASCKVAMSQILANMLAFGAIEVVEILATLDIWYSPLLEPGQVALPAVAKDRFCRR